MPQTQSVQPPVRIPRYRIVRQSLGVEMARGQVIRLIAKGTRYPVTATGTINAYRVKDTRHRGRWCLRIPLCQGEGDTHGTTTALGTLQLSQQCRRTEVLITFSLAIDGALTVHAESVQSKEMQGVRIWLEDPSVRRSRAKVRSLAQMGPLRVESCPVK